MRKSLFTIALLATTAIQAQVLYVNNANDTYQAIETKNAKEVTFNESNHIVTFEMLDGVKYMFNTDKTEEISLKKSKAKELTYNTTPTVSFNANDKNSYTEVTATIPTNKTEEEYGDFVENFSITDIVTITFSSNKVTVTGATDEIECEKNGAHLTITSEASKVGYIVSGSSNNGSLKIYSEKKFQIMLSGLDLTNPAGPAINIQTGKTVYFTLDENTSNCICDGAKYSTAVNGEDQKGTLFSEGQLIFDGTGTLNVTSYGGHGICSDDYIRIHSGNINILQAAKDGFHTNDKFIVTRTEAASPSITINATANGIDCGKGEVIIEAGKTIITSGGEAIKAENEEQDTTIKANATIKGGYISFTTSGEKSSGIKSGDDFILTGGIIEGIVNGDGSKIINSDGDVLINGGKITGFSKGTSNADNTLSGGIKCEGDISVKAGDIAFQCTQSGTKGINSKGSITIDGGSITIVTNGTSNSKQKSQAMDCDYDITINGGHVILSSYNNTLSATLTTVNDGVLNAYSTNGVALNSDIKQKGGWIVTKEK